MFQRTYINWESLGTKGPNQGAIEPDLSNLASYRPVASVQLTPVAQPVAQAW